MSPPHNARCHPAITVILPKYYSIPRKIAECKWFNTDSARPYSRVVKEMIKSNDKLSYHTTTGSDRMVGPGTRSGLDVVGVYDSMLPANPIVGVCMLPDRS
jgi:hypothetical protein